MAVYNCHGCVRNADHTLVAYLAVAVTLQLKARVCLIGHLNLIYSPGLAKADVSPRRRSDNVLPSQKRSVLFSKRDHRKTFPFKMIVPDVQFYSGSKIQRPVYKDYYSGL